MSTGTFFSSGNLQADRRFEYALSYALQGEMEAAIELLGTITDMAPHWPAVPFMLGTWLVEQGLVSEAQGAFQQALSLDPIDRLGAAVKLRMITGDTSGDPLPAGYVKSLFDEYAPRFDAHLQNDLDYGVPSLMYKAVKTYGPFNSILDLGCGTGLSAAPFCAQATYIEGVDLSPGMLAEARKKGIYTSLAQGDLLVHLQAGSERFDLMLGGDVFNYCGSLAPIFAAAKPRLKDGGILAFCLQLWGGDEEVMLGADHRFSHNKNAALNCLMDAGFDIVSCENHPLRKDGGVNVAGLIIVGKAGAC
ncbi:MAG TPA: methyltransferase domain-containing protein [Alphaproteobacteria bacterium]|nr:methyltransferase domain-containing protein [Alphaproteobacteria bacterium]